MSESVHVVCPQCDAVNRVLRERLVEGPRCGRCSQPLFQGASLALNAKRFARHLERNELPLLVDFWAPWCGPCQMMAPAFEKAAARLEPHMRLIKVNTEEEQDLAYTYQVRSIPTLILLFLCVDLD